MHLSLTFVLSTIYALGYLTPSASAAITLYRPRASVDYSKLTEAEKDGLVLRRRVRTANAKLVTGGLSCPIYVDYTPPTPASASTTTSEIETTATASSSSSLSSFDPPSPPTPTAFEVAGESASATDQASPGTPSSPSDTSTASDAAPLPTTTSTGGTSTEPNATKFAPDSYLVDVRACPSHNCPLIQTVMKGDFVLFACWTRGKAGDQDLFWDKTVNGTYISETYITGNCPYMLPPCFE